MSSYTQILYQLVFGTKHRKPVLLENNCEKLYKYMWGILNSKKCMAYQIGGVKDHVHIITHIHPMIAPAMLVKDIKVASSIYIKEEKLFPDFTAWQVGYGAFTYSMSAKNNLIAYVKNQKEHHLKKSFKEEYIKLLNEHEVEFDEDYLF